MIREGLRTVPRQPSRPAGKRPYAALGERIRAARTARRLLQQDLAESLDVTQAYISKIERGAARPEPIYLEKLAAALDVDVAELEHLAGYTNIGRGDRLVRVPGERVVGWRQLQSLSDAAWRQVLEYARWLEYQAQRALLEPEPAQDEPTEKRRQVADQHDPHPYP